LQGRLIGSRTQRNPGRIFALKKDKITGHWTIHDSVGETDLNAPK
jgi:hypothetical protein